TSPSPASSMRSCSRRSCRPTPSSTRISARGSENPGADRRGCARRLGDRRGRGSQRSAGPVVDAEPRPAAYPRLRRPGLGPHAGVLPASAHRRGAPVPVAAADPERALRAAAARLVGVDARSAPRGARDLPGPEEAPAGEAARAARALAARAPRRRIAPRPVSAAAPRATPGIARRLASALYDLLLVAALVLVATFPFLAIVGDATLGWRRHLLQAWVLAVSGAYFVWFWTRGGRTLAMKTWHIRLVTEDGGGVKSARAIHRFVL